MEITLRVLWVAEAGMAETERRALESVPGSLLHCVASIPEALSYLEACRVDAVVAEFPITGWTPAEVLEEVQRANPAAPVLIRDAHATAADGVRWARLGAWQVLDRDAGPEELVQHVEAGAEERRTREKALRATGEEPWRRFLVGESRGLQDVCRIVRLVGPRRCTVLITGESGTGKEMLARAIHMAGPRGYMPLVAVSCSALPENLLEAELFGHVKGAFTGAVNHRVGRFEQANGSTLFLDEIGEMPLDVQAKLLRVLQEREFQRLGSSETVRVDVRVIAATNVDLAERVRQGRFREDLYYRLNVVPVEMPPLRDRPRDIPILVHHFMEKICGVEGIPPKQIGRDVLDTLTRHSWPGNVRQLENAVEMAVVLSGERSVLYASDFPACGEPRRRPVAQVLPLSVPDEGLDFERTVSEIERSLLEQALRKTGGNKTLAADMLRLKRTTLAAKLRSLEGVWAEPMPALAGMVQ